MKASLKCHSAFLASLALALTSLAQTNSSPAPQASSSASAPTSSQDSTSAGGAPSVQSTGSSEASSAPAKPADPQPLPNPAMTGPLQTAVPHEFNAGPFGKLAVTGILSGMGLTQGKWVPGDKETHWDLSNGQVFIQKTTGWWQFYLQGGAYNLPALGTPFLSTSDTIKGFYGPFPQGYLKLVKGNFSVMAGALPTLVGAEYTFSFENMNIERGLLWNQENAVNRGVQFNETYKKLTASLSWNDGFYSNRYTWLWGSLTYAYNSANSLAFIAGGNYSQTGYTSLATPIQNNSQIYNVIYTYSHEAWVVQPYFQYTNVPTNTKIGITRGASTRGGALLLTYNFKHGVSMAVRPEYISSTGSVANGAINLLYGPGSGAFALTVTPTYRKDGFFLRGDFSVVHARDFMPGAAFGPAGLNGTQPRGLVEAGFMF
ncbi:MAG: outer membrane beta-barrel protein [Candidatus Acidiferrum sp.]